MEMGAAHWHVATGSASDGRERAKGRLTATRWQALAELISRELGRWVDSLEVARLDAVENELYEDAQRFLKRCRELDDLAQMFDYEGGEIVGDLAREHFPRDVDEEILMYVWECTSGDCRAS